MCRQEHKITWNIWWPHTLPNNGLIIYVCVIVWSTSSSFVCFLVQIGNCIAIAIRSCRWISFGWLNYILDWTTSLTSRNEWHIILVVVFSYNSSVTHVNYSFIFYWTLSCDSCKTRTYTRTHICRVRTIYFIKCVKSEVAASILRLDTHRILHTPSHRNSQRNENRNGMPDWGERRVYVERAMRQYLHIKQIVWFHVESLVLVAFSWIV